MKAYVHSGHGAKWRWQSRSGPRQTIRCSDAVKVATPASQVQASSESLGRKHSLVRRRAGGGAPSADSRHGAVQRGDFATMGYRFPAGFPENGN